MGGSWGVAQNPDGGLRQTTSAGAHYECESIPNRNQLIVYDQWISIRIQNVTGRNGSKFLIPE